MALSLYISCRIDSPFENLFSSLILLVKKAQLSYVSPKHLNEVYINMLKFLIFPLSNLNNSAASLTFLVLNLNGTKTLMGFIRQHAGFCPAQKLKLPSLVMSRTVRFMCEQNTSSSDVLGRPTWRPGNGLEPKGLPDIFIWATNFEVWAP